MEHIEKNLYIHVALKHGWTDLGKQKMVSMLSFTKGHRRLNIYTTTHTITIQDTTKKYDKGLTLKPMLPASLDDFLIEESNG